MSKEVRDLTEKYDRAYAYVRNWDLTEHDEEVLAKYNLRKWNYWYCGSTVDLKARNSKFSYQMLEQENLKNENAKRYENNKTKVFINNLYSFYKNEFKLTDTEIKKIIFTYSETIEVPCKCYILGDEILYLHELLEAKIIGQYITVSKVDERNCILSLKDTEITSTENSIKTKYSNKFYTSPIIRIDGEFNNRTRAIIKQNMVIPTDLQEIYESLINSDIIRLEELLNLDIKKPSKSPN